MNTFFQKLIANDNCYSSFRYVIEDQKKSYQTNNRIDFLKFFDYTQLLHTYKMDVIPCKEKVLRSSDQCRQIYYF